ncbi:hypothetical protein CEXT_133321 [Caerostris extrusa]|uniref:Uncharacterized protein n=1 Tax=Caerostris extrusa TaxID=172846 RepID=A0AAV4YCH0_CAEEX|nr:hypothetical protein CEXT_133321 [Caerostris extrusa]
MLLQRRCSKEEITKVKKEEFKNSGRGTHSTKRKDRAKGKSPNFPVKGLPDRQTGATQVAQSGTNPLFTLQGPPEFKTITWAEPKTRKCSSKRWSKEEINKKKKEKFKELRGYLVLESFFSLSFYSRLSFFFVSKKVQSMEKVEACLLYS